MNFLHAFILGAVEGLTEFLPISSTGHLIIASRLLGIANTEFLKSFEIIIQLGAICAVVVLYFNVFIRNLRLWKILIVAFIPTGIIGLVTYSVVKKYLLGNTTVVLWSLFLGGIVLIAFELLQKHSQNNSTDSHKQTDVTFKQAFAIGTVQALSIIPGVSRSAATIVGGSSLGLTRKAAVEFSFLLAVPTMLAASGLDIIKNIHLFTTGNIGLLLIGFVTAFIVGCISIIFFLRFVEKHTFITFGVYRIVAAIIFFLLTRA